MQIRFLNVAQLELDETFEFYEEQIAGLGHDFLAEVLATLKRIKQNAEAWSPFSERTRRCLVNRFPYGIVYQVREDEILVVAVSHLHRKPFYWENRIKK